MANCIDCDTGIQRHCDPHDYVKHKGKPWTVICDQCAKRRKRMKKKRESESEKFRRILKRTQELIARKNKIDAEMKALQKQCDHPFGLVLVHAKTGNPTGMMSCSVCGGLSED